MASSAVRRPQGDALGQGQGLHVRGVADPQARPDPGLHLPRQADQVFGSVGQAGLAGGFRRQGEVGQFLDGRGLEEGVKATRDSEALGAPLADFFHLGEQVADRVPHPLGGPAIHAEFSGDLLQAETFCGPRQATGEVKKGGGLVQAHAGLRRPCPEDPVPPGREGSRPGRPGGRDIRPELS